MSAVNADVKRLSFSAGPIINPDKWFVPNEHIEQMMVDRGFPAYQVKFSCKNVKSQKG